MKLRPASHCTRRTATAGAIGLLGWPVVASASPTLAEGPPERRWYDAAEAMKRLAESWGDQPYGAVLVMRGSLLGSGPSRVVKHNDPDAHAEREAIGDAQRRLGRSDLAGAVNKAFWTP